MDAAVVRGTHSRAGVAVAAVTSIAAGLVHAAAARNHEGDVTLVWMFALCAAAQVLWGALVLVTLQPKRALLLIGVVINGGAVLVWALSRTTGIPFIDSLSEVEAVGVQDLGSALFAGASVLATVVVLVRPSRPPQLPVGWVGGLAAVALVAAFPALTASHTHTHAGHGGHEHLELAAGEVHGDHEHGSDDSSTGVGHEHGSDDTSTGGDHADSDGTDSTAHSGDHAHGDSASTGGHDHTGTTGGGHEHALGDPSTPHEHPTDPSTPHDHPTDPHEHPTDPTDPHDPDDPHEHPTDPSDPIISIDDPRVTEEQFNIAVGLIVRTGSGMAGFMTEEDVLAAGYTSIGDGGTPGEYTHYINWALVDDAFELDAGHIESVVMKMNADGTSRVVAGMYILSPGATMADAPPLAGELTTWHDHDNLCFDGGAFVGLATDGVCPLGVLGDTPPMLHVWTEANPCGPFAVIDEHGTDCGAVHTH